MRTQSLGRASRLLAVVLALGLVAAACGDSSDSSSTTAAPADTTAAAGGDSCDPGSRTIGVSAITLQSPAVTAMLDELQIGADLLGWKVELLNSDGDPAKMAADVAALANQNVDAIVNIAIPVAAAQQGMELAFENGIPVIGIGSPLLDPDGLIAATYAPSDADMSNQLADQMFEDFAGQTGKIFVMTTTGIIPLEIRSQTVIDAVVGTDLEISSVFETDLAAAIQNTQTGVANSLRADGDINIIWAVHDFQFTTSLQTIESQGLQEAAVYGYYPPAEALAALRDWTEGDAPLAAVDSPVGFSGWFALDSLVTKWCNPDMADWTTDESIKTFPIEIITPANVPAGDAFPFDPWEPFFAERWVAQGVTLN